MAWLAAALLLACVATAALADGRDPRCDGWEANGAPPGTEMAAMCPAATGITTADVDIGAEPAYPYLVGLLVMAAVLTVFGLVVMRFTPGSTKGRRAARSPWTCPACGAANPPDRGSCFACHETRASGAADAASFGPETRPAPDPGGAETGAKPSAPPIAPHPG